MPFHLRSITGEDTREHLQHKSFLIEQICLALVFQIALINFLLQFFKPLDLLLPGGLLHLPFASSCAVLTATLSLFCSESSRSHLIQRWGKIFAVLTALLGVAFLFASIGRSASLQYFATGSPDLPGQSSATALAFVLMGFVIFFVRTRGAVRGGAVDIVFSCQAFLVLLFVLALSFGAAGMPGSTSPGSSAVPTFGCLALLTVAIVIRRAEYGLFGLFLGTGIGGRVARLLAPILIIVPFLRELGRARLLNTQLLPKAYSTAVLTSTATAVSLILLGTLVMLINSMQRDIQNLTLRDELTGLYNFRGFNLFAEQAFRLARRAQQPFGVLFIDMDNLKTINDEHGHHAGSACIAETAKLLNEIFREVDVIGRLGGDEFVVAGQFDHDEIETAIKRLRSGAESRSKDIKDFSLSFSLGFAATQQSPNESLKSIVARADHAMYREKRAKKRMAIA
jgi:diguanylate cyclase (GGDEF)-like protein